MYQKVRRWTAWILVCLCLATWMPVESLAATKSISSVRVRISSKIKAGQKLPDIEIGSGSAPEGGILVTEKGSHFKVIEASWMDSASKEVVAADEPRMRVVLEPDDVSEYYFLASYKGSSVKVRDRKSVV